MPLAILKSKTLCMKIRSNIFHILFVIVYLRLVVKRSSTFTAQLQNTKNIGLNLCHRTYKQKKLIRF